MRIRVECITLRAAYVPTHDWINFEIGDSSSGIFWDCVYDEMCIIKCPQGITQPSCVDANRSVRDMVYILHDGAE